MKGRNGGVQLPPIHFYHPASVAHETARASVDCFVYQPGNYVWTVKTYGALSRMGFPCHLGNRLPDEGIIVTHRELLPNSVVPNERQLFVCAVADFYRHPFAQLHVVQNPYDSLMLKPSPSWPAAFMPMWPEAGLIPRDPARGERFSNVSYFGLPTRLAPQLRSERFAAQLREKGFVLRIVDRHQWNDYSDTDAVLAVRSFADVSFHKFPATKLYNSWLAGVPALLGRESAYQAERRSELDYFEVGSPADVLSTLCRLREDHDLRAAVERNCAERAAGVTAERVAERWAIFLSEVAAPAYHHWCELSPTSRKAFLLGRSSRYASWACRDFVTRGTSFVRKRVSAVGA